MTPRRWQTLANAFVLSVFWPGFIVMIVGLRPTFMTLFLSTLAFGIWVLAGLALLAVRSRWR